jgi:transcriptional regulator with XRE-family HTH domain
MTDKGELLTKDIGLKIKTLRLEQNLTQKQFAQKVGCHQDHISRIEAGKINLTLEYISKIADILNVSVEIIFKNKP